MDGQVCLDLALTQEPRSAFGLALAALAFSHRPPAGKNNWKNRLLLHLLELRLHPLCSCEVVEGDVTPLLL